MSKSLLFRNRQIGRAPLSYKPQDWTSTVMGGNVDSETMWNAATDPFCILDRNGFILDADPAFCSTVGYARAELTGMHFSDIDGTARPEDFLRRLEKIRIVQSDQFPSCVRRKEGQQVDVILRMKVADIGGEVIIIVFAHRKGRTGSHHELFSNGMLEGLPAGCSFIDDQGIVQEINSTLLKWLGYGHEDLVGLVRYVDLVDLQGRNRFLQSLIPTQLDCQLDDIQLIRKDGGLLPVRIHVAGSLDGHGFHHGYKITALDVKREKMLEAQLLQAQKLESLGTLVGGVAHDFNNVLTGIIGFTQLMMEEMKTDDDHFESLKRIETLAGRAAEMVGQLLAFSRREDSHRKSFNLHPFLIEICALLKRIIPETIKINLNFADENFLIEADATQIQQVIINLAVNARDAMPDGGFLGLQTTRVEVDDHLSQTYPNAVTGAHVRMSISDTGVGIPPEILSRIFDPFFTTKSVGKGTGLGLPVTNGIVKNHGGFIMVESRPSVGTTVHVHLPLAGTCVAEIAPSHTEMGRGSETILLAEDEPSVLELAQMALEYFGYHVVTACDGLSALAQYKARKNDISLVVVDLVMPRLGGSETIRELRRMDPTVKVLLTTGYDRSSQEAEKILADGTCRMLRKPYGVHQLIQAVRMGLGQTAG